jgi:hypothetical protein
MSDKGQRYLSEGQHLRITGKASGTNVEPNIRDTTPSIHSSRRRVPRRQVELDPPIAGLDVQIASGTRGT